MMEEQKTYGNVYITDDMLHHALMKMTSGHENWGIKMLFHGMLQDNHMGAKWFIKFMTGEQVPHIPEKGQEIYVSINRLGYTLDADAYEKSPYNENGFIKCVVASFEGFHHYSPITVEVPSLDPSNKTKKTARVDFGEFKFGDDDFYDKSELMPMSIYNSYNGSGRF